MNLKNRGTYCNFKDNKQSIFIADTDDTTGPRFNYK